MQVVGVIVHHSVCPSINGKGYDFFVTRKATLIPAPELTEPGYIHICVEGDFSQPRELLSPAEKEQLFVMQKLILRLSETFGFDRNEVHFHNEKCPGHFFPWQELVISQKDGYH